MPLSIVKTKIDMPSISLTNWPTESIEWSKLNNDIGGDVTLSPLTIKAIYVLGVIHDICESVSHLLVNPDFARQVSYIPSVGLYASGIEILGRCIKGEQDHRRSSLRDGLQWLVQPAFPIYVHTTSSTNIISTTQKIYTIEEIESLRNFAAHGQATASFYTVDYEILASLHPLFRRGLTQFVNGLGNSDDLCNNLAKANIVRLRGWPVLKFQLLIQNSKNSINTNVVIDDIFGNFDKLLLV